MGNKKKKKKKESTKPKHTKSPAAVDERWKKASELEPPEENPFKQDNEKNIDRFLRYGLTKKKKPVPIKLQGRKK